MLLKRSIAIALFATSSFIGISTAHANTDAGLIAAANALLNHEEGAVSGAKTSKTVRHHNDDAALDSAAILLGISVPQRPQTKYKPASVPVTNHSIAPQHTQVADSRQQRLLNKRKRENLQRLRNKKRRLNHQKQLARIAKARQQGYQRVSNTSRHQNTAPMSALPANSVWHRVRNGFRFRNDQYRPSVQRAIRSLKNRRAYLMRTLNRSSDYLHLVATELQRRGMPTDLILLPMVESAYVTKARSHAGAAGMWQFIRGTGRMYGLRQTRGYDGRLDIMASTRAAMSYLQKLHREFHGDWFLALAAYNCGEHRVHREILRNKAKGLPTDYWSLSLPRETKNYVPKLLAYREAIRSPRSFGVRLPNVANSPKLIQVHFNKAVDLKKVAYTAGVEPSLVKRLNPAFKYGITMPSMTRKILVPRQYAGNIQAAIHRAPTVSRITLAKYSRATPSYRYKRRTGRSSIHRVRRGENLSRIASRYGMSLRQLKRINRIRGSRVIVGKRLRVASYKKGRKAGKKAGRSTHRVRRGENLSNIASRYGMTVRKLKRMNKIRGSRIRIGARLKVAAKSSRAKRG
jgi:membrane-bound lytic murein transglycosylase D